MARELTYNEIKRRFDPSALGFETTGELAAGNVIIGQGRAARALEFGLNMKSKGYNLYVSGESGVGKTTFATVYAQKIAATEALPPDLCYVYHFKEPKRPKLVKLTNGLGAAFKADMEDFTRQLAIEIPRAFGSKDFEEQKNGIVKAYQTRRDDTIRAVSEHAKTKNFGVKMTNTGIYFMPMVNGEMISEEQYDALPDAEKEEISRHSDDIQEEAAAVMSAIKAYEEDTRIRVEALEYNISLFTVGRYVGQLQEKYADEPEVLAYLAAVKEDALENCKDFLNEPDAEEEYLQNLMPWMAKKNQSDFLSKYKVNLLTNGTGTTGAPVVVSYNPTFSNLIGEVEYDSEFGNLTTDFMKIKPGLLHKANGGYLVLQAHDLLTNLHAWDALRKAIKTGEIEIEPMREYATGVAVSGLKPEPVPLSVKVILVGVPLYYELLSEYDDDFAKLFRMHAAFDYEIQNNDSNVAAVCRFVKRFVQEEQTAEFDCAAVAVLLEYATRLSERQDKLTAQFNKLWEIMAESATWARLDASETITASVVRKAIAERESRLNLYEDKLSELIEQNVIMIDTTGKKVGQINGLAVLDTGDYVFAKPSRITATAYVGKAGIVNIEKEAEMSGAIHDKGVQVLIGYLGQTYAQEFPLSLSCRICFEQNYSGIDGDSASSTELYAVLSSLSGLPVNQELAVTGSMNQHGEIQAIGGVTHKVEGFFDLCQKRGLTGKQGVIIPEANVRELVLSDEVAEAVRAGVFHIYAINSVDEGLALLLNEVAGTRNEKGKFPASSVHGKVYKRLKDFHKKSMME